MQYKSMQAAGQIPATLMPDTPQVQCSVLVNNVLGCVPGVYIAARKDMENSLNQTKTLTLRHENFLHLKRDKLVIISLYNSYFKFKVVWFFLYKFWLNILIIEISSRLLKRFPLYLKAYVSLTSNGKQYINMKQIELSILHIQQYEKHSIYEWIKDMADKQQISKILKCLIVLIIDLY